MESLKRLVITGASGFLGANLCRYFNTKGYNIIAIQSTSDRNWRIQNEAFEKIKLDLTNKKATRDFFGDIKPFAVLNCAAYGAYSAQLDIERVYNVNFNAVRNIVEAVSGQPQFKAFIQAGSSSEYGLNSSGPSEDSITAPDSEYAVSKVAATSFLQYQAKKRDFPAWILRLYSIYGPWEDPYRLVPTLLMHARENKLPKLVNQDVSRDFIYVDDVVRAFEQVILSAHIIQKGEIFNIGTGKKTKMKEIVQNIQEIFFVQEQPRWDSFPGRDWDRMDWFANINKSKKILNWVPEFSLSEGLKKTMLWINENEADFVMGFSEGIKPE